MLRVSLWLLTMVSFGGVCWLCAGAFEPGAPPVLRSVLGWGWVGLFLGSVGLVLAFRDMFRAMDWESFDDDCPYTADEFTDDFIYTGRGDGKW